MSSIGGWRTFENGHSAYGTAQKGAYVLMYSRGSATWHAWLGATRGWRNAVNVEAAQHAAEEWLRGDDVRRKADEVLEKQKAAQRAERIQTAATILAGTKIGAGRTADECIAYAIDIADRLIAGIDKEPTP